GPAAPACAQRDAPPGVGQRLRRPRKRADADAAPRPGAGLAGASAPGATSAGRGCGAYGRAGFPAIERSSAEPGLTVAASGTMRAFRIRVRTSPAWAG